MGVEETIAAWILLFIILLFCSYFIIRPLMAIGDIPIEIRKLRESIDKLVDEIRRNRK